MNAEQKERGGQVFLEHIRFWEVREGWPHFTDEEIRAAYEQRCRTAGLLSQESRRRKPPAEEIVQGLPSLIAADMKKWVRKQSASKSIPLKPAPTNRPPTRVLPGSVPLP